MSELVEFLRARLDEAARSAEASGPHPVAWLTFCDADGHLQYTAVGASADERGESGIWIVDGKEVPAPAFVHVIYDPARVLREVQAKRRIMARHIAARDSTTNLNYGPSESHMCAGCGFTEDGRYFPIDECPELRDIAMIYEGAPGWQEAWRV